MSERHGEKLLDDMSDQASPRRLILPPPYAQHLIEAGDVLEEARLAFFAGMCALGDALAAHCAPDGPVRFGYPDWILYDAAPLGGARFATPESCSDGQVPDWMIFAVELIANRDHLPEPGAFPDSTSLQEEDFAPAEAIVESFASYLMLWLDRWAHKGCQVLAERYLERVDPPLELGARGLADGDLMERLPSGEIIRHGLAESLAACRWRDGMGPRL